MSRDVLIVFYDFLKISYDSLCGHRGLPILTCLRLWDVDLTLLRSLLRGDFARGHWPIIRHVESWHTIPYALNNLFLHVLNMILLIHYTRGLYNLAVMIFLSISNENQTALVESPTQL